MGQNIFSFYFFFGWFNMNTHINEQSADVIADVVPQHETTYEMYQKYPQT